MTYENAKILLGLQNRNIRKVNGTKFTLDGYEYRITYFGGFSAYVGIDRRQVGKRTYTYFGGVGAYDCWTIGEVMELIKSEIEKKNR